MTLPAPESPADRAARLALALALGRANAAIARVRALHAPEVMHQLCEDEECAQRHGKDSDGCRVHPESVAIRYCGSCSTSDLVDHPCATVRAIDQPRYQPSQDGEPT